MIPHDFALLLARVVLGSFFVIYRFRWIWDPSMVPHVCNVDRHAKLRKKLCSCGWPVWLAPYVALGEISAGLGLIFGFLTYASAAGILLILIVATMCTAREKTMRQNPVDSIDVVSCYLWNPEPVYITLAVVVLAFGSGRFSLDHLINSFL